MRTGNAECNWVCEKISNGIGIDVLAANCMTPWVSHLCGTYIMTTVLFMPTKLCAIFSQYYKK